MTEILVRATDGAAEVELLRVLMREYAAHLAANPTGAANICLTGFEAELAGLPAPYTAPGALLLAWVQGEPAGCVALKQLRPAGPAAAQEPGLALEVKRLWVRTGFRGLGLGRRLMDAAIHRAQQVGAVAVYLDTVPAAMPEANRMYEAMGFERVARYNQNPVPDVVFYRRTLAGDQAQGGPGSSA